MLGEKLQFLALDDIQQQMPVEFPQNGVPFYAQEEGAGALALLADKPLVNSIQLREEFKGEFCNFLIFADETGFDGVEHRFRIFGILLVEGFEFGHVFGQERVEEDDGLEVVVDAFDDDMGEKFVLVGEETENLLEVHAQGGFQDQDEELEGGLGLFWIFVEVYFFDVDGLRGFVFGLIGSFGFDRYFAVLFFGWVSLPELPQDLDDESVLALEDELLDPGVHLDADGLEGQPG